MVTITLALLAACVAGFCFKTTRGIGIAAMTALILLNPGAFMVFLGVGVGLQLSALPDYCAVDRRVNVN